jgi:hypothetical protein
MKRVNYFFILSLIISPALMNACPACRHSLDRDTPPFFSDEHYNYRKVLDAKIKEQRMATAFANRAEMQKQRRGIHATPNQLSTLSNSSAGTHITYKERLGMPRP